MTRIFFIDFCITRKKTLLENRQCGKQKSTTLTRLHCFTGTASSVYNLSAKIKRYCYTSFCAASPLFPITLASCCWKQFNYIHFHRLLPNSYYEHPLTMSHFWIFFLERKSVQIEFCAPFLFKTHSLLRLRPS